MGVAGASDQPGGQAGALIINLDCWKGSCHASCRYFFLAHEKH